MGPASEVCFTALWRLIEHRDNIKLHGNSHIYALPIYGLWALGCEQLYLRYKVRERVTGLNRRVSTTNRMQCQFSRAASSTCCLLFPGSTRLDVYCACSARVHGITQSISPITCMASSRSSEQACNVRCLLKKLAGTRHCGSSLAYSPNRLSVVLCCACVC